MQLVVSNFSMQGVPTADPFAIDAVFLMSARKDKGSLSLARSDFPASCGVMMAHRALELDHLGSAPPRHRRRTRGWGPATGHRPEQLTPFLATTTA